MKSDKAKSGISQTLITVFISFLWVIIQSNAQTNTGKYWIKAADSSAFTARSGHQIISFKGKLWLIGGNGKDKLLKDVWNSEDAINWTLVTDSCGFEGGTAIVFNEMIWVINTNDRGVWNSTDGHHWQKVSSISQAAEWATRAIVFKDKIWLTGGADVFNAYFPDGKLNPDRKIVWRNDVWSSSDGIVWKNEDTTASFSNRSDHSMAVFNNKIWVLCGQSGPNKNDIWNSTDGINWQLVTNAPFIARHVSEVVVYKNMLWVIGGFGFDNDLKIPVLLDDIWNSTDGINWSKVTEASPFGTRMEHRSVVFNKKLWLIGGSCGTFPNHFSKNDIWYTEENIFLSR